MYYSNMWRGTHTHTHHIHTVLMSSITFGIAVLTNTLLLHRVVSSFFHWNFEAGWENSCCLREFPFIFAALKKDARLYLWADISSLSYILHATKSNGVRWPIPPGWLKREAVLAMHRFSRPVISSYMQKIGRSMWRKKESSKCKKQD